MAAARSPPLTQQTLALVLLVFAATTAAAASAAASLPPYCGVQPGTPVPRIPALTLPPSPAVAQLQQVMVLIRHGDRTNIGTPPCWPNDSTFRRGKWKRGNAEKGAEILPFHQQSNQLVTSNARGVSQCSFGSRGYRTKSMSEEHLASARRTEQQSTAHWSDATLALEELGEHPRPSHTLHQLPSRHSKIQSSINQSMMRCILSVSTRECVMIQEQHERPSSTTRTHELLGLVESNHREPRDVWSASSPLDDRACCAR